MRAFVGTTNPSKIAFFRGLLAGLGADTATPHELGVAYETHESGATPEENARLKATFYDAYADYVLYSNIGLYFDALPLDET